MSPRVLNLQNACLNVLKKAGKIQTSTDTRSIGRISVPVRNNIKTDILEKSSKTSIERFKEQCLKTAISAKSIDDYVEVKNLFAKSLKDIEEEFCFSEVGRDYNTFKFFEEAEELADTFTQSMDNGLKSDNIKDVPGYKGGNRVAGIIYGTLIKHYEKVENYKKMIELSDKSLPIHIADGDHFRILQRKYSKSNGYKGLEKRNEHYKAQKEVLKEINYIIKHYKESCQNYSSMKKRTKSMEDIIKEKITAGDELAMIIAQKKRNKAVKYLKEAINYYKGQGERDKLKGAEVKMKNLKTSKAIKKLQKRERNDIWGSKKNEMGRLLKKTKVAYSYVGGKTKTYSELEKKYEKVLQKKKEGWN